MAYVAKPSKSKPSAAISRAAARSGLHPAYQKFGDKAADAVLRRAAKYPAGAPRQNYVKTTLNAIDPTLWTRANETTKRYLAKGLPAAQASRAGLSRAMATGLVAEVYKLGASGKAKVPDKGMMGLGAYGGARRRRKMRAMGGLGGVLMDLGSTLSTIASSLESAGAKAISTGQQTAPLQLSAGTIPTWDMTQPPVAGDCKNYNIVTASAPKPTYPGDWPGTIATAYKETTAIWQVDPTTNVGKWVDVTTLPGFNPSTQYCTALTTDAAQEQALAAQVRANNAMLATNAQQPFGKGPIVVKDDTNWGDASSTNAPPGTQLQVGPFVVPIDLKRYIITMPEGQRFSPEWSQWMQTELQTDCQNCTSTSLEPATAGHTWGAINDFLDPAYQVTVVNKDIVNINDTPVPTALSSGGEVKAVLQLDITFPDQPLVSVSRPDTGEVWGMFLRIIPQDPTYPWDSTSNPYVLQLAWLKQPTGVWDFIKHIVGVVIDAIGDALDEIGDLACDLLGGALGQVGGTLGGAALGAAAGGANGAKAGAVIGGAGAQVANAQCNPAPPVVAPTSDLLPVLLIGGGLLLVLAIATKPRRADEAP